MAMTSVDPEKALIGALLLSPENVVKTVDIVKIQDFSDKRASQAYATIVGLWQQKKTVDLTTVAAKAIDIVGYLAESTSGVFAPGAVDYAYEVALSGKRRRIVTAAKSIAGKTDPDAMLSEMLSLYQAEMSAGKKNHDIKAVVSRFNRLIAKNKAQGRLGIETGFQALHDLYVSYVPGHVWICGGWTSTGKTAVMIQQIANILTGGEDVGMVVVSTEMTEEQLVSRLVANLTGVHSYRVLTDRFNDNEEEERVVAAKEAIASARLTIYDDVYTLTDIETAFRKAELQGGVDVGWIDYVQNCRVPEAKSEYQEQATLAKRLQILAKDTRSTLIALSQVSNDVGRGNTDQLEFKGAGELAAVADVGIMLQRNKTKKYLLKFDMKKNRHGKLGEMGLEFQREYTSLKEVPLAA